jgi:hypothetical protein
MPNHIGEYSEDWMGAVVVQKTKQEVSIIFWKKILFYIGLFKIVCQIYFS